MLQPQTDTKEPTAQQGNGRGPGGAAGLPPPPTAMEQPPQPALVEPEVLPRPRMNPCSKRTLEVVSQGRIHAVDCLVSLASDAVYGLIRTLRPAIYGKVKLGMTLEQRGADGSYHMVTDKPVAVKIIRKDKLGGRSQEDPLKEIAVMQHLSDPGHPNVMGLVEVLEDPECIYLVLPFCDGGEICQWFERSRYMLREEVARGFFLQILSGLQYLHARGVVHRDMSLENLLYDQKTRRCIIIDLGMYVVRRYIRRESWWYRKAHPSHHRPHRHVHQAARPRHLGGAGEAAGLLREAHLHEVRTRLGKHFLIDRSNPSTTPRTQSTRRSIDQFHPQPPLSETHKNIHAAHLIPTRIPPHTSPTKNTATRSTRTATSTRPPSIFGL